MTEARNRNQWLSVASFLALQNLRTVLQQKARRAEGAPLAGRLPRAARLLKLSPLVITGRSTARGAAHDSPITRS